MDDWDPEFVEIIRLTEAQWDELLERLAEEPQPNPKLQKLLERKAPWDKEPDDSPET